MITAIHLENFKGVSQRVSIPLSPITLLFGKNSAGKSTVLHSLLYVHELLESRRVQIDRTTLGGESIDLGGYYSLVHKGCEDEGFTIRIDLDYRSVDWIGRFPVEEFLGNLMEDGLSRQIDLAERGAEAERGWIEIKVAPVDDKPTVHSIEIGFDDIWFAKVGKYFSRNEVSSSSPTRILMNEIHPLLALPGEEEALVSGNLYGNQGRNFQSALYHVFFDEDRIASDVAEERICEFLADEEIQVHLKGWIVSEEVSMEAPGIIGRFGGYGVDLARNKKNELEVRRIFTIEDVENPEKALMFQLESVDEFPVVNLLGDGIPDLTKPLSFGWPLGTLVSGLNDDGDEEESLAEYYHFMVQLLNRLVQGPLSILKDQLDDFRYIGPLRSMPPRHYVAPLTEIKGRWSNGMAAWDLLHRDTEQHEEVSRLLKNSLNLRYEIQLRKFIELDIEDPVFDALKLAISQYEDRDTSFLETIVTKDLLSRNTLIGVRLFDTKMGTVLKPNDVGVGLSQVIPVVVGAIAKKSDKKKGGMLAVEQPELHVHPAVEVGLGDVFIEASHETGRMMLIETHSEHLLLRLMRRIRETSTGNPDLPESLKLSKDDLKILFVEVVDGECLIRPMPVNDQGELVKAWPGGFFEEDLEELF